MEHKGIDKKLRESDERFRLAFENANTGVCFVDLEGHLMRVNKQMCEIFGYDQEELESMTINDFTHPEDLDVGPTFIKKAISGEIFGDTFEKRFIHKQGHIVHGLISSSLVRDSEGTPLYFVSQVQDITERKRLEEALKVAYIRTEEERAKSEAIVRGIGDALNIVDNGFKIAYQNQIAKELSGSHVGEYCYSAFRHLDKICKGCPVARSMKDGMIYSQEMDLITEKGKLDVDVTSSPLKDSEGNVIGGIEVVRDITERKRAEEEIKKYSEELKRSNELKDLFTDILRHDLLNPAGIVKGYTEVLLDREENEQKLQFLYSIERNNKKLIDMIETAAKFAKLESIEELEFKEMDIGVIFKEVVENFRSSLEEKKMLLEFTAEGRYPASVNLLIEEVFANLLSNAIKYSPEESRIIIDIMDAGEDWKVSVTDFGDGISEEDKSKLFERFKRLEKGAVKGTGLGLAIVKRLITLHGGSVGVEDNPEGQGSRFWVTVKKA